MPKTKTAPVKAAAQQAAKAKPKLQDDSASWVRTLRETIESVVIAFILAFLFRTFEAEAFVIPTGSMAPTLQGRHKDIVCPKCGYEYRTGASDEVTDNGELKQNCGMEAATCPMCRYTVEFSGKPANKSKHPSYSGDRIIVSKFAYDLSSPERWDIVVFKYPEDAKTNYIKRLIGLPDERIKIQHGNIYVAPLGSDDFKIARKGDKPNKLQAMLQPVYDNDYTVDALLDAGFPARWQPWPNPASPWTTGDRSRSFATDGKTSERAWLRYQHLVPSMEAWEAVDAGRKPLAPSPQLISDFYAYNDGDFPQNCGLGHATEGWVGDLAIDCQLDVSSQAGSVILELIKGGRQFHCTIDLATGEAALSIPSVPEYSPKAKTSVRGRGTYELSFANVDEQLLLWVDGDAISFDKPTTYDSLNNYIAVTTPPAPDSETATDLSPVGIAVEGGTAVKVSHLNLRRDIYYIGEGPDIQSEIDLEDDQFFMLGDNSPRSKDGRYWNTTKFVNRSLLIGKALFIYWPHSFDRIEIGDVKIPFPFWPNFKQMGFVR